MSKREKVLAEVKKKLEPGNAYFVRGHYDGDFEGTCESANLTFATFRLRNGETREIFYGKWLEIRPA